MQTVRAVYDQHKGRYGARRIAAALSWNKKKAERLMKKMNLKAIVREKRKYYPPAMGEVSENLLNRNFSAEKPDEKWLTDVTEFKCDGQKLYLSPILDLYNREIRSYHLSRRVRPSQKPPREEPWIESMDWVGWRGTTGEVW